MRGGGWEKKRKKERKANSLCSASSERGVVSCNGAHKYVNVHWQNMHLQASDACILFFYVCVCNFAVV